nr:WD repeat-containing protein WRAP73-like isoform X2 [Rhipicephalus microplus]
MSFSRVVKESPALSSFSPNGKHLAVPCAAKVTIYNSITFQEIATISNVDVVDAIEWSPDSKLLLCLLLKPKIVQVWHPEDTTWKCRISEGSLGLISACWSPDSQHILTTADFQIRTTVWSLVEKSVLYLKQAKLPLSLRSFSQSGEHLAVVERRDSKDFVSIINCKTWTLEQNFPVASEDIADLLWAPNAETFCIWESPRTGFQLYVYSTAGAKLASFGLNEEIIGIKSLSWSHCGQVVLLESFDDKIMLLETVAWGKLLDYELPEVLTDNSMIIYKEVKTKQTIKRGPRPIESYYEVVPIRPVSPGYLIRVGDGSDALSQQTAVKLSASQNYLARISATFPNIVFILDIRKLILTAVLVHLTPVTWPFHIKRCQWNPRRKSLIVHGQDAVVLCSLSHLD